MEAFLHNSDICSSKFSLLSMVIPNHEWAQLQQIQSQPPITCSKLTIETLEEGVKYVQS